MEEHIIHQGKSNKGISYVIRYPQEHDSNEVWRYINKLSKEKTFVRFQGEVISLEDEIKYIANIQSNIAKNKSVVLFLVIDNSIHGICNIDLHDKTESHVASLGISVDHDVRGQGLGKVLMQVTIEEAKKKLENLKIIKLELKEPNTVAFHLYTELGFLQYGYLPKGTSHQGDYVDEIFMYKEV